MVGPSNSEAPRYSPSSLGEQPAVPTAVEKTRALPAVALLALYVVIRILLLPADLALTPAFSHDSSYIAIVARNLLEGKGYVNDANWLLFLNPAALPMPFHNANPLYPTLCAALARLSGIPPVQAGAVISIFANALLALASFFLVRRFHSNPWFALGSAVTVALWPSNWQESLAILPDALATALSFSLLAIVVSGRRNWYWAAAAGIVFGLAWLTRSTVILVLPGLFCWMWFRQGLATTVRAAIPFFATAAFVASPWLIHTAQVRGSPLKSDATYYWLQDYYASRTNRTVDQYYRSLTPPPSAGTIIRQEGGRLLIFGFKGIPRTGYAILAQLSGWNKPAAVALLAALAAGLWAARRWWLTAECGAMLLVSAATFFSLVVRLIELRYFGMSNTFLAIAAAIPFAFGRNWLMLPAVLYALLFALPQDYATLEHMRTASRERIAYRAAAEQAASLMAPGEAIIAESPYYFTYFTRRQAVSPPYGNKAVLLDVMRRYHASQLLLPSATIDYYYPEARRDLPPELAPAGEFESFTLFRVARPL